jgi:hypothetical protein
MKVMSVIENAPGKLVNQAGIKATALACIHSGKNEGSFHHC